MTLHAEAIHDAGVLRLLGPLPIGPQQRVRVAIEFDAAAPAAAPEPYDDWLAGLAALGAEAPTPLLPADFSRADVYADGRG